MCIHAVKAKGGKEVAPAYEKDAETATVAKAEVSYKKCSEWDTLVWSILLGDMLHNIAVSRVCFKKGFQSFRPLFGVDIIFCCCFVPVLY